MLPFEKNNTQLEHNTKTTIHANECAAQVRDLSAIGYSAIFGSRRSQDSPGALLLASGGRDTIKTTR